MRRVLIANRGEIAVRVIRACRDLGLQAIAVYSEADAHALHVHLADEAICIGPAAAANSYLKQSALMAACEVSGADALHPGYGFLSENSHFAAICRSCNVTFIGPTPEAMALLGDKFQAKQLARKIGIPSIAGSEKLIENFIDAKSVAGQLGYPILLKAVAGGGGRGIRCVNHLDELESAMASARAEAKSCFGNGALYLEKCLLSPRHVEIQILGDQRGHLIHLNERDCTLQRRRQKLLEESPSPFLDRSTREKMGQAALKLLHAADYHSLGTVEFLLDGDRNFYFMEVNARAQVEHTVTEELTGIDLIREQIQIAAGADLNFAQSDVHPRGHVMQMRINAEDPANHFLPSPGQIKEYLAPAGPHVRVDSACYPGCIVSPHYDSLIAKLIVRGRDRADAIGVAKRAISEFQIKGIATTLPLHKNLLLEPKFLKADYDLDFIDQRFASAGR